MRGLCNILFDGQSWLIEANMTHPTGLQSLLPFNPATLADLLRGLLLSFLSPPPKPTSRPNQPFISPSLLRRIRLTRVPQLDSVTSHPNVLVRPVAKTLLLSSMHVFSRPLKDQVHTRNRSRVRQSSRQSHMAWPGASRVMLACYENPERARAFSEMLMHSV